MIRSLSLGLSLLAPLAFALPAQAVPMVFTATLDGGQEVPPNDSPGTGSLEIHFDTEAETMRLVVQFSGLASNTVNAHIHQAPPGVNGPIVTPIPTFPGFPLGVTAGMYDQTFDLTQASTYNPNFLTDNSGSPEQAAATLLDLLLTGNAYFNIHTVDIPAGEIRGDISRQFQIPVLSGAPLALLAAGLGWLGWRRFRSRAAA